MSALSLDEAGAWRRLAARIADATPGEYLDTSMFALGEAVDVWCAMEARCRAYRGPDQPVGFIGGPTRENLDAAVIATLWLALEAENGVPARESSPAERPE